MCLSTLLLVNSAFLPLNPLSFTILLSVVTCFMVTEGFSWCLLFRAFFWGFISFLSTICLTFQALCSLIFTLCFHTCTQLPFTFTITFPFTFSFTVTIIFLFSLLIMEKMPAFILVILQLAFVNWWMKSMIWIALFKNFTRDKLGMEALTQPYFYKTVHSPLWLGLSLFLLFFFQTKPFTFILLSFFSIWTFIFPTSINHN